MSDIELHFIECDPKFEDGFQPLSLSAEERQQIALHWKAVNQDGRFFNGPVLTATEIKVSPDAPALKICVTDYAHYLYATSHPDIATTCRNVYCGALLVTIDNRLMIAEMSSGTSAPGRLQFVGGNIELSSTGDIDARHCCQREITEEVGAGFVEKLKALTPFCIKTGGLSQHVGIFYLANLSVTAEETLFMFDHHQQVTLSNNETPELARLHLIELKPLAAREFCAANNPHMVDYLAPLLMNHLEQIAL